MSSIHPLGNKAIEANHNEAVRPSIKKTDSFSKDTIHLQKENSKKGNSFFASIGNCLKKIWAIIVSIFTCSCYKKDKGASSETKQTQSVTGTDKKDKDDSSKTKQTVPVTGTDKNQQPVTSGSKTTALDSDKGKNQQPVTSGTIQAKPVTDIDKKQQPVSSGTIAKPVTDKDKNQQPVTSGTIQAKPVTDIDKKQQPVSSGTIAKPVTGKDQKDQATASVSKPTASPTPSVQMDPQLQAHIDQIRQLAKSGQIDFYNEQTNPATAFLGNFQPCEIIVPYGNQMITFFNSEAYFQAQKFWSKKNIVLEFAQCTTGDQAFQLARKYAGKEDNNKAWHSGGLNSGKEQAMRRALVEKFNQKKNQHLKQLLMATYPAKLNEHNQVKGRDNYWSDDSDGTGQNRLGKLLEELREFFLKQAAGTAQVGQTQPAQQTASSVQTNQAAGLQAHIAQVKQLAKSGKIDFFDGKTNPVTAFLGNGALCRIEVTQGSDTLVFNTSEALFQAQKFPGIQIAVDVIAKSTTGGQAFQIGRKYDQLKRKDWNDGGLDAPKEKAMKFAITQKFQQNKHLRELLLATFPAKLNAHPPQEIDTYWTDNNDGKGQNRLGKLLEELRAYFMQQAAQA